MKKQIILLFILFYSFKLMANPVLVNPDWVLEKQASIVIVDIQEAEKYQQFHIPNAINMPFSHWREVSIKGVRGVLPSIETLTSFLGRSGVTEKDAIVIVSTGIQAGDISAAARVFWTLKLLGHKSVSILDGGLVVYANAGNDLEKSASVPDAVTYNAEPDLSLLATKVTTLEFIQADKRIIDARTYGEYMGIYGGGGEERNGTLPKALNLPYEWLLEPGTGNLRNTEELETLYQQVGIEKTDSLYFCHTGNRAALNWFVDWALLGNKKAKLYDASTAEWAVDDRLPMVKKINLK